MYASTREDGIYVVEDDCARRVAPSGIGKFTTYWLHANEQAMLSVGERDLVTYDGASWAKLPLPG